MIVLLGKGSTSYQRHSPSFRIASLNCLERQLLSANKAMNTTLESTVFLKSELLEGLWVMCTVAGVQILVYCYLIAIHGIELQQPRSILTVWPFPQCQNKTTRGDRRRHPWGPPMYKAGHTLPPPQALHTWHDPPCGPFLKLSLVTYTITNPS